MYKTLPLVIGKGKRNTFISHGHGDKEERKLATFCVATGQMDGETEEGRNERREGEGEGTTLPVHGPPTSHLINVSSAPPTGPPSLPAGRDRHIHFYSEPSHRGALWTGQTK